MPRYAATRTLLAPLEDVWAFLADPYRLADWWPGVAGVQPDRRGLAPGARWQVIGPNQPSYFRRPQMTGTLLVLDVVPMRRIAFQLSGDRIDAELELEPEAADRTRATLAVEVPWLIGARRSFPHRALAGLHALVQTAAE
ncbi:MAG: SRPBCC family protein [Thermoleophilia bacterium]|nr:SRPBCC family protein [Thermoleophilia bacterium]